MTLYERKLIKIKSEIYHNQKQIDAVIEIRKYIDHHCETDLNLDHLSNAHQISKYHLLRLFKKYYGLTPRQYMIDKRIILSKKYLSAGISVTETCFTVGFESLGSFSTLFKARTGKSPSHFQKEQFSRSI